MHPKPLGLSSMNLSVLGLSVLLALSSSKSLSLWLSLELNLFSILPLLLISGSSSLTYFVAQTLGSVLMVYGLSMASLADGVWLGFLMKLGLAPYFSWYIEVLSLLTGVMFWVVATLQKVHLLSLLCLSLSSFSSSLALVLVLTVASVPVLFLGSFFSSYQSLASKYQMPLAYMSIIDSGMLLWVLATDYASGIWYFMGYSILLLLLVLSLEQNTRESMALSSFSVLALSGFPPFGGYFLKVELLYSLSQSSDFLGVGCLSGVKSMALVALVIQFVGYMLLFISIVNTSSHPAYQPTSGLFYPGLAFGGVLLLLLI